VVAVVVQVDLLQQLDKTHHQDLVVVAHILQITKGEHPAQQEMTVVMVLVLKVRPLVAVVLVVLVEMSLMAMDQDLLVMAV
jgi:hypothetical protein|tara:strand:- start:286 stop:528 length:243 start_codon:yes stop_codon:yes gene_type:complete